jgi:hypothetical protein
VKRVYYEAPHLCPAASSGPLSVLCRAAILVQQDLVSLKESLGIYKYYVQQGTSREHCINFSRWKGLDEDKLIKQL